MVSRWRLIGQPAAALSCRLRREAAPPG